MSDPWVKNTQQWYNVTYSAKAGFNQIEVDGYTGWQTMYALTRALQYELGLTTLSDTFGPATLAALTAYGTINSSKPSPSAGPANIIKIAQGALYCKGYNAGSGALTGVWDTTTRQAMSAVRGHLGLTSSSSDLPPKLFKFLLTMDSAILSSSGDSVIRDGQRAMNGRYLNRKDYFIIPADGIFGRDVHRALIFSIQYDLGLEDGVANGYVGPTTKSRLQNQANIGQGSTDSTTYFVRWFNLALRVNGYASTFSGTFTSTTATYVRSFEQFVKLPITGRGNLQTWCSLLISTGDDSRSGAGADCITTLTADRLSTLRAAGYTHFGRYLANTVDNVPEKELKRGEAARIITAGGRIFPIFQTGGGQAEHFTAQRGKEVAEEAAVTAWANRIPANAVIYFSVDYDVMDWEVTEKVIPYFQAVNDNISNYGRSYRVGIYGPRNVCKRVSAAGLAVYSFVSDMSVGYSGNIGQSLPSNWSFDQIQTLTIGSSNGLIEIDKNVVSGRDVGISALAAQTNIGDDPLIPTSRLDAFRDAWLAHCKDHGDYLGADAIMQGNSGAVAGWVRDYDAYITSLAKKYQTYKALVLTVMIWEGLAIHVGDAVADDNVRVYYSTVEHNALQGNEPAQVEERDCSTGPCQIFAETAIRSRNWASSAGLITDRQYNFSAWRDRWEVWWRLHSDYKYNIETALFVMMYEANTRTGVAVNQMRNLTPAQVMTALIGYNGGDLYGRKRMPLYYLIQRWHQDFRS